MVVRFLLCFLVVEIIANIFIYYLLLGKCVFNKSKSTKNENEVSQVFKGVVERLVLCTGLVFSIHSILIAFGALKVATKLSNNNKVGNDYYFIGNMFSILIALLQYQLIVSGINT